MNASLPLAQKVLITKQKTISAKEKKVENIFFIIAVVQALLLIGVACWLNRREEMKMERQMHEEMSNWITVLGLSKSK